MMKWFGILMLVLAVAVRLRWVPPVDLAIRESSELHRGYSLTPIVFWVLVAVGVAFVYFGFRRNAP